MITFISHDFEKYKLKVKKHKIFLLKLTTCCAYGTAGVKTVGYDCLMIPGAEKKTIANPQGNLGFSCQGGGGKGLNSVVGGQINVTICSKYSILQWVLQ